MRRRRPSQLLCMEIRSFPLDYTAVAGSWTKVTRQRRMRRPSYGAAAEQSAVAGGTADGRAEMGKRAETRRCGGGRTILFR
jgi:hypothetical protein